MSFEENFKVVKEDFDKYVKIELEKILGQKTRIFSIEDDDSSSEISKILDTKSGSDLLIEFSDEKCTYLAGNRIIYKDVTNFKYDIQVTFRNSINGITTSTELDKLKTFYDCIINNIPVVMPRFLCYAKILEIDNKKILEEIIVLETIPTIEFIFSNSKLNICKLREQFKSKVEVLHDTYNLTGIRTKNDATFLFIHKKFLKEHNLIYAEKYFENTMKEYYYSVNNELIDKSIEDNKLSKKTKKLILNLEQKYDYNSKEYYIEFVERISFDNIYTLTVKSDMSDELFNEIKEIVFSSIGDLEVLINEKKFHAF
ncbi:hypothetical protein [Arcobacter sp.]|uniref:hypothetical protein n=1 Tax=unclassified Arcobacter TaxID=2593671 RepID=UPI003B0066F8